MSGMGSMCIDVEAAAALVRWKSQFAEEVAVRARRLAAESKHPGRVTLSHYRKAAMLAVHLLSISLEDEEPSSEESVI